MQVYEVLLSKTVRKQINALSKVVQERLLHSISNLSSEPRPRGCKKFKGYSNLFRIRNGDYRIIYEVEDNVLKVIVIAVGNRKDIYK